MKPETTAKEEGGNPEPVALRCGAGHLHAAQSSCIAPTLPELIDAGAAGMMLVNPDNGVMFRAVYANWLGVLPGVKIFPPRGRRSVKSPIMSHEEIAAWLAGLRRSDVTIARAETRHDSDR